MKIFEKTRSTTTEPEKMFEEMFNAIGERLSDLASSEEKIDGEDEHDHAKDTELGKLSEDDEPGWVMGTISAKCILVTGSLQECLRGCGV
jgi:hypothetical protein